jgi:hypothetical protein
VGFARLRTLTACPTNAVAGARVRLWHPKDAGEEIDELEYNLEFVRKGGEGRYDKGAQG